MANNCMMGTVTPDFPESVCTPERLAILGNAGFSNYGGYFYVEDGINDWNSGYGVVDIPWRETIEAMRVEAGFDEVIIEGAFTCDKMRAGEFGGWVFYFTKYGIEEGGTQSLLREWAQGHAALVRADNGEA